MKAILENGAPYSARPDYHFLIWTFCNILDIISYCKTEDDLRHSMKMFWIKKIPGLKNTKPHDYFKYGFGSNHMWVSEIDSSDRLIFVKF